MNASSSRDEPIAARFPSARLRTHERSAADWADNRRRRPLSRAWIAGIVAGALCLGLLYAALPAADGMLAWRKAGKQMLAVLIAPYLEMLSVSVPIGGEVEYVIFLRDPHDETARDRFLAHQAGLRFLREGTLAGTLVVSVKTPAAEPLAMLRQQPWVRLTVRNQGLFFCH